VRSLLSVLALPKVVANKNIINVLLQQSMWSMRTGFVRTWKFSTDQYFYMLSPLHIYPRYTLPSSEAVVHYEGSNCQAWQHSAGVWDGRTLR